MSIIIGVGVVTCVTVFYIGKKSWQAFHRAVGITPGVLTYQDPRAPVSLPDMRWRQLKLNTKHLERLSDKQLRQLQRIDEKVSAYEQYQHALIQSDATPTVDEAQFVLQKWLHTRLPDMLASHYHLTHTADRAKKHQAEVLVQEALDDIEQRLESLIEQTDSKNLQDLQVMRRYMSSHGDGDRQL